MQIRNALNNLFEERLCIIFGVAARRLLCNQIQYLLPVDQIHHDVHLLCQLIEEIPVRFDNVFVIERLSYVIFFSMRDSFLLITFPQNLDCKWIVKSHIVFQVAFANSAIGSLTQYFSVLIKHVIMLKAHCILLFLQLHEFFGAICYEFTLRSCQQTRDTFYFTQAATGCYTS